MEDDSAVISSDDEPVTAQSVLRSIEEAWLNEKFCPEILPNQQELVDCMLQQIQQMEDNISKLKRGDFRIIIHRMELDRIRFIISSYLRNRLEKIETFTADILDRESKRSPEEQYLSEEEYKFACDYLASIEGHFQQIALQHMPSNFQALDKKKCIVSPNLDSHIFLAAKRSVSGVTVKGDQENGDEEVNLEEGSQHIMQYQAIADLLKCDAVRLI